MGWPEGFMWGTGASSTQAEGAAPASDWYRWERDGRVPRSGEGNGFATRHAEDFALYAEHGLTHHRLSLEWARLEPRPGQHDQAEVERYREMLQAAGAAGVSIWACLHHFTLPGWFADDQDGFRDDRHGRLVWSRHVDWVAETFGDLVAGWKPVNEPVWYALGSHLFGQLPPGRHDRGDAFGVLQTIHRAGADAARLLRTPATPVAMIQNLSPVFRVEDTAESIAAAARFEDRAWDSWASPEQLDAYDYIGFSYYSAAGIAADGSLTHWPVAGRRGAMGYVPWAEGLGHVLHRLAEAHQGRPILICEVGIGTDDEVERRGYAQDVLGIVQDAISGGVDVRGLFWWTGVDNYEWHHGYDVQFGLFDRDRNPRPAAEVLKAAATS